MINLQPDDLRYEVKMVCDRSLLPQARSWIRLHPAGFVVAYPPRRVNSLYIDTPHLSSLNDNLEGLSLRQKLRLRWYGDEMTNIQPYLELKQKRDLLGRKERHLLPCELDMTLPWREILQIIRAETRFLRKQSDKNLVSMLQTVTQPTLNHYQREYYVTADGAIRVTLDFDQAAYDQRLSLRPNLHIRLPINDTVVIEVKTDQEHAERLQEIAGRFPVRRSRNSKYAGGLLTALG
jgi:hypothetical protein